MISRSAAFSASAELLVIVYVRISMKLSGSIPIGLGQIDYILNTLPMWRFFLLPHDAMRKRDTSCHPKSVRLSVTFDCTQTAKDIVKRLSRHNSHIIVLS